MYVGVCTNFIVFWHGVAHSKLLPTFSLKNLTPQSKLIVDNVNNELLPMA